MTAEPPEGSPRMRMCPRAATSDAPMPTSASSHKGRKGTVGPAVPAAMIVMKNATSSTSSSIEKYPSASCSRPRLNAPLGRYRVRSAISAAEQHARVGGDEQREHATDNVDGQAQDAAKRPAGITNCSAVPPVEHERLERGNRREEAEDQERPDANRHRGPVLEVEPRVSRRDVDEHVPELPPARAKVAGQEHRADQQRHEARVEADARGGLITRVADQPQKRRDRVAAAREAGEEEVPKDVPRPLRRSNEVLCGEIDHDVPRRLKATTPAITPSTAVTIAPTYPPRSLRVGSFALSAFGSPYVSGLSMRRKKALSPP